MANYICPHCLREQNVNSTEYYCTPCSRVVPNSTGPIGKLFGDRAPKCSLCGRPAHTKVCASCQNAIPPDYLQTKNLMFSIVGVAGSGKSNYVTVMLHELKRATGLGLALNGQDRATTTKQEEHRRAIYEDRRPLDATLAMDAITPMIYKLKNSKRGTSSNVPTYSMTVFDSAGENIEGGRETMDTLNRYIALSKAIIFLLDPMILSAIRREVDEDVVASSSADGYDRLKSSYLSEDVINSIAELIRQNKGMNSRKKIDTPIAITFSKIDVLFTAPQLAGLFEQSTVKKPSPHNQRGYFDLGDQEHVHFEIEKALEELGELGFLNTLDANFKSYKFFGVSSFGQAPKNGRLGQIVPHRVLDPVLWLLANDGIIDER